MVLPFFQVRRHMTSPSKSPSEIPSDRHDDRALLAGKDDRSSLRLGDKISMTMPPMSGLRTQTSHRGKSLARARGEPSGSDCPSPGKDEEAAPCPACRRSPRFIRRKKPRA
jgi:hypothetical protein